MFTCLWPDFRIRRWWSYRLERVPRLHLYLHCCISCSENTSSTTTNLIMVFKYLQIDFVMNRMETDVFLEGGKTHLHTLKQYRGLYGCEWGKMCIKHCWSFVKTQKGNMVVLSKHWMLPHFPFRHRRAFSLLTLSIPHQLFCWWSPEAPQTKEINVPSVSHSALNDALTLSNNTVSF